MSSKSSSDTTITPWDPPADARALLFDCDGTLVDTMGLYKHIWTQIFDEIITADDVIESKPAPDIYLLGMQRLNVQAHEVAVYEDSAIGRAAVVAAGVENIIDVRE